MGKKQSLPTQVHLFKFTFIFYHLVNKNKALIGLICNDLEYSTMINCMLFNQKAH